MSRHYFPSWYGAFNAQDIMDDSVSYIVRRLWLASYHDWLSSPWDLEQAQEE